MDNYQQVVHQMQEFGVEFLDKDLPLQIDAPKRRGCGRKGKWWYWLRTFRPDAGGSYIVGRFGSYKTGESRKVDVDWQPLAQAERDRLRAEREAALERARQARAQEAELAALGAADLWRRAERAGRSPYLDRKGVQPEACRFLPDGSVLVPLLRYDMPRDQALRAVQRIKPDGSKLFTKGFAKPGCSVRLGDVQATTGLVLVCEGFATGLTLRMATERLLPVYVALDAGTLAHVVPLVRELHPRARILVCADDDYRTRDHEGELNNPGRASARAIARQVMGCDLVWPAFPMQGRGPKDTDFNDLQQLCGLDAVRRQMAGVLHGIRTRYQHG